MTSKLLIKIICILFLSFPLLVTSWEKITSPTPGLMPHTFTYEAQTPQKISTGCRGTFFPESQETHQIFYVVDGSGVRKLIEPGATVQIIFPFATNGQSHQPHKRLVVRFTEICFPRQCNALSCGSIVGPLPYFGSGDSSDLAPVTGNTMAAVSSHPTNWLQGVHAQESSELLSPPSPSTGCKSEVVAVTTGEKSSNTDALAKENRSEINTSTISGGSATSVMQNSLASLPAHSETVNNVKTPQTVNNVKKPEIVNNVKKPETVNNIKKPETVNNVKKPETVINVKKPETVNNAKKPETVNNVKKPETVNNGKNPETVVAAVAIPVLLQTVSTSINTVSTESKPTVTAAVTTMSQTTSDSDQNEAETFTVNLSVANETQFQTETLNLETPLAPPPIVLATATATATATAIASVPSNSLGVTIDAPSETQQSSGSESTQPLGQTCPAMCACCQSPSQFVTSNTLTWGGPPSSTWPSWLPFPFPWTFNSANKPSDTLSATSASTNDKDNKRIPVVRDASYYASLPGAIRGSTHVIYYPSCDRDAYYQPAIVNYCNYHPVTSYSNFDTYAKVTQKVGDST